MRNYSPEATERDWQRHIHERYQRELGWKLELNHQRFEEAWERAHQEGKKALDACAEGRGYCFVRVRIPDGLFASWLVKTGKAKVDADFDGMQRAVRIYRLGGTKDIHDCARQEAYAKAFVRVMIEAGIDAYDESRLD